MSRIILTLWLFWAEHPVLPVGRQNMEGFVGQPGRWFGPRSFYGDTDLAQGVLISDGHLLVLQRLEVDCDAAESASLPSSAQAATPVRLGRLLSHRL